MVTIEGKKILFIAPKFYDYHVLISSKLAQNNEVVFFSEKIDGKLFSLFNTVNSRLINIYQKFYFLYILFKIRNIKDISHLFVIRGYKMPEYFLKKVRKMYPNIICLMYQWDSSQNNHYTNLLKYFDRVFTFDYSDFQSIDSLDFLQLFYTEEIQLIQDSKKEPKYDFFCFNSFTMSRYNAMLKFQAYCKRTARTSKIFCYIPWTTYIKVRVFKGIKLNKDFLSFNPMPRGEYLYNLEMSKIVVDLSHSTQTGLSMRVIEAYGAGKKILTTNNSVIFNPIYNSCWINLFDIENIDVCSFSFEKSLPSDGLYIDNWINHIFKYDVK